MNSFEVARHEYRNVINIPAGCNKNVEFQEQSCWCDIVWDVHETMVIVKRHTRFRAKVSFDRIGPVMDRLLGTLGRQTYLMIGKDRVRMNMS